MDQELLSIVVSRQGSVKVRLGGIEVQQHLEKISVDIDKQRPSVILRFIPTWRDSLFASLKRLVDGSDWVRIIKTDTLPSGMPAVTPEEDRDE